MKKNISINISGIIFYIEEDGYDKLKEYLDSINSYFSKFDESNEIVNDIESRIAEIFLAKLKDGKQVITSEDVDSLIATMGSIRDFKAVQEPEEEPQQEESRTEYSQTALESKKLFRDTKRKVIGGVAAGLGNYFSIDPLWIRLIFLLLFVSFFFEFEISLIVAMIYIIMWIVIPGSDELKEGKKYRKMYRNSDDKVLGGVSSGIASYFGIDVVVVRLLFVVLIFAAFSGPIIYVLLWIIIPEAKSITEKMEMQGEPVTLSNIEENIKKSLNVKEGEENTLVKILLLPFRLLSLLINWLGKILSPLLKFLVEAVRILAGLLIIITGVSTMFGLLVILGAGIGLLSGNYLVNIDFMPIELIQNSLPLAPFIATIIVVFIPSLFITLLGVMIISKTNLIKPGLGWSLFAIWIIASLSLAISIPKIVTDFRVESNVKQMETFDIDGTAVLTMEDKYPDVKYDRAELRIRAHEDSTFLLEKNIESRGKSIEDAQENARMLIYHVNVQDSIIAFPYSPTFTDNAVFRVQNLEIILYVPYEQPFVLEPKLANILRNTLSIYGYRAGDMKDNVWKYTREDSLLCITCDPKNVQDQNRETVADNFIPVGEDVKNFNFLDIGNTFVVNVKQGNDYQVEINNQDTF
ncbi:MAG: PspC domain-containing protein [Cyclobacteriaceae bacterium]